MSISLKVYISSQDKSSTMRFVADMSIDEVRKQIQEKTAEGGADHGIFQPPTAKTPGRWLRADRTVGYYDLTSGDEIHYRKKHRKVKVQLLDGTQKVMLLDDSQSVSEVVDVIAEKMGFSNSEEYSLMVRGNWLNTTLSLHENGVKDDDVVVLQKKFFFTDLNIDRSDPIQLHLLFLQSKEAIISGKHPTTKDEAVLLAALQVQVQYGNHNPSVHKPGFLNFVEFLPVQYAKQKALEKDIYKEHKKVVGLSEINAKYRYVQACRALKTYGITTFAVKEKKRGRNRFESFLIGITRDSIVKLDEETKEIVKTWPLTQLRRWAASDKTFTLDFGDYEEDYLSLLTMEGENISQIIAGYIDIILKRKKMAGRVENENDALQANEVMVAPIRAAAVQTITSTIGLGGDSAGQAREQILHPGQQQGGMMTMGGPQTLGGQGNQGQAGKQGVGGEGIPITDLASALEACNLLIQDLANPASAALLPGDISPEEWRKQVAAHANALGKGAIEMMNALNKGTPERVAVDGLAKQLGLNISALVNAARHAATGSEEDISLLLGAKAISTAISDLLKCAKDITDNPNNAQAREAMKHAAEALKAAQLFLSSAQHGVITDQEAQDLILESAKAVAAACAQMVGTTYEAARGVPDAPTRQNLITVGKGTGAATNALVSVATAVAPGLSNPQCRTHFIDMARGLDAQCGTLSGVFKKAVNDPQAIQKLNNNQKDVGDAIAQLIDAVEAAAMTEPNPEEFTTAGNNLLSHLAQLINNEIQPDPQVIRNNTKGVQDETSRLVGAVKLVAPSLPNDSKQRILASAKAISEAVAKELPAARKDAIEKLKDPRAQTALADFARNLTHHVDQLMKEGGPTAAAMVLRHAAKRAAADTTFLVASAKTATASVNPTDLITKQGLVKSSHEAQLAIGHLVEQIKNAILNPKDALSQGQLLDFSKNSAMPALNLVTTAKRSAMKITDPQHKQALLKAAEQTASSLQELLGACKALDELGQNPEVSAALEQLSALIADLDSAVALVDAGYLTNVSGQTRETALEVLDLAIKTFEKSNRELAETASRRPDKIGNASSNHATNIASVVQAAKDVASTTADKPSQKKIINAAKDVSTVATKTLQSASKVAGNPSDPGLKQDLGHHSKASDDAVQNLMHAARGLNASEVDEAVDAVRRELARIAVGPVPRGEYQQYADQLTNATRALSAAVSTVVASAKTNPKALGASAKMTAAAVPAFVTSSNLTSSASKDPQAQESIVEESQGVVNSTAKLLDAAKMACASGNSNDPNLTKTAQAFNDSIARLLNAVAPGKREMNDALSQIMNALSKIHDRNANTDLGVEDLNKATKKLGEAIMSISSTARQNPDKLGQPVKIAAESVVDIVDAAKALTIAGDGTPADISHPIRDILNEANILRSTTNPTEVVGAAKVLAHAATRLVAGAKNAASQMDGPKRTALLQATQELATTTAGLARSAKGVAARVPGSTGEMISQVAQLETLTKEISEAVSDAKPGRKTNDLLMNATRGVADATSVLINNAGVVSSSPGDQTALQSLTGASSTATDSLAKLINLVSGLAPGVAECDKAIEEITDALGEIDSALLAVAVGGLKHTPPAGLSHQDCLEEMVKHAKTLALGISTFANARADPMALAKAATEIGQSVPALVNTVKNAVVTTGNVKAQTELLRVSKNVSSSMFNLVTSGRGAAAAPKDTKKQADVVENSKVASQAISKMITQVRDDVITSRDLDEAIQTIQSALAELDSGIKPVDASAYQQCKNELSKLSRQLAMSISNLCTTAKSNADGVGPAGKTISNHIPRFIGLSKMAAGASADKNVQNDILNSTKDVTKMTVQILELSKVLSADQRNPNHINKLSSAYDNASTAISNLLNALKKGAVGERETERAVEEIGQIIADLDAAALFAAAGQLEVDIPTGSTYAISEAELKSQANKIAQEAGKLGSSPHDSVDETAPMTRSIANSIAALAQTAKLASAQIPDAGAQQALLGSTKDAAVAAQQLISASQRVTEKKDEHNLADLADRKAKVDRAAQNLIRACDTAAADAAKGIKELESATTSIRENLKKYQSPAPSTIQNPTNDHVIGAARSISAANAHVVIALNTGQDDLVKAVHETAESAASILDATKAAIAKLADKPATKDKLNKTVVATINATSKLLEASKAHQQAGPRQKTDAQLAVSGASSEVMERINEYVNALRELPGGAKLSLIETDFGDDLEELAEKELRNAAAIIEAAAASLLAPRERNVSDIDFNLDETELNEAIIEAARAIAIATATLVKSAAQGQRERVAAGKNPKTKHLYKKDPTWANGLISAAQTVAATTQLLVTTANNTVLGKEGGDQEHLVACANSVAAATAQLVAASKAKADPMSQSLKLLSDAAKSVGRATSSLVAAIKNRFKEKEEEKRAQDVINAKGGILDAKRREIERQAQINKLEKELQAARQALLQDRRDAYSGAGN